MNSTSTFTRGQAIFVPPTSAVDEGDQTVTIRKARYGAVDYAFSRDGIDYVAFDFRGRSCAARAAKVQLVSADDHSLIQRKFNRGGHPIAGWNWPLWGYRYSCACGVSLGEDDARDARRAHAEHIERVAGGRS